MDGDRLMIGRRSLGGMMLVGVALAACGGAPTASVVMPSAIASPAVLPSPVPSERHAPSDEAVTERRLTLDPVGAATLPPILVTAPESWNSDLGWAVALDDTSGNVIVALTFWDVAEAYGHPCDWAGSLFDPGPAVRDLADALTEIPLRNATTPVDVTVDGYSGSYLEWTVPADMDFSACDVAAGGPAFESWTARGWSSDRYQQGPGQIDRLWILDVDGTRLVIDAFDMPAATDDQRQQLREVVESIEFER
jgi:hypothetical protein